MNDELEARRRLAEFPLYLTPPHPCSYLEDRQATTLFIDPRFPLQMADYAQLAELGFRRSGSYVYRPECGDCHWCIPVRVPVARFRPNRSQRRCLRANADLAITETAAVFSEEHFRLYRRYMSARHAGGGMDKDDPEAYLSLISAPWCDSRLLEFRLQGRLLAVAAVDRFPRGLSAVYTFFEPEQARRGLGVFAVLTGIRRVREAGQEYLYPGFWNPRSPKMAYKSGFRPLEYFGAQGWRPLEDEESINPYKTISNG